MPDSCRADSPGSTPPDICRASVLGGFLDAALDSLVRTAAAPKAAPMTAARPGRGSQSRPGAAALDTVDDRWLAALRGPEPRVDGNQEETSRSVRGVGSGAGRWRCSRKGPFRLCFRLEEPAP